MTRIRSESLTPAETHGVHQRTMSASKPRLGTKDQTLLSSSLSQWVQQIYISPLGVDLEVEYRLIRNLLNNTRLTWPSKSKEPNSGYCCQTNWSTSKDSALRIQRPAMLQQALWCGNVQVTFLHLFTHTDCHRKHVSSNRMKRWCSFLTRRWSTRMPQKNTHIYSHSLPYLHILNVKPIWIFC